MLSALGLDGDATGDDLTATLSTMTADRAEARITRAGGIAARVRDVSEGLWRDLPTPGMIRVTEVGSSAPRLWRSAATLAAPASGIRVLDLTRVIAGPVATRTLGLFGADVLRIDSPRLPEIAMQHLDTGQGKHSATLDLDTSLGQVILHRLLASADVVVLGYRPGSVETLGLGPSQLAARYPGLIIARLSAWGTGPGGNGRRGFDSIVQAATGIAVIESKDGVTPGALPVQALDHSAGYLLAAGVLTLLERQRRIGGTWLVETSLLRVARALLDLPADPTATAIDLAPYTVERISDAGLLRYPLPAPAYEGGPTDFAYAPHPWGSDPAEWNSRD
jgi:hypothetical protein